MPSRVCRSQKESLKDSPSTMLSERLNSVFRHGDRQLYMINHAPTPEDLFIY